MYPHLTTSLALTNLTLVTKSLKMKIIFTFCLGLFLSVQSQAGVSLNGNVHLNGHVVFNAPVVEPCSTIAQQYTNSSNIIGGLNTRYIAGKVTITNSFTACTLILKLKNQSFPTGTLSAGIFTDNSGVPGTLIEWSSTTYDESSQLTTSTEPLPFHISSTLTPGTYHIVIDEGNIKGAATYVDTLAGDVGGGIRISTNLTTWTFLSSRQLYYIFKK
ncbi:MAG TPA: hypothetical protein VFM25_10320 [Verrucomicrobiae bacterium]|nr:hypothetical protein [Verrucomicrobiae bacterium]